jgi:4a-hydroxytetrahydrobiopterin dehydratase
MTVLDEQTLRTRLADVPGWELRDGALRRDLRFANFSEAFGFMTRVALQAEKLDHHPDWSNSWNRVSIGIVSHSAGGVTDRCVELAAAINQLAPPDA